MSNKYVIGTSISEPFVRRVPKTKAKASLSGAAALAAFYMACATVPAHGDSVRTNCHRYWHGVDCTTTFNDGQPVTPIELTDRDRADIEAVNKVWRDACKPRRVIGPDGLARYEYARKDCDIGRTDGEIE